MLGANLSGDRSWFPAVLPAVPRRRPDLAGREFLEIRGEEGGRGGGGQCRPLINNPPPQQG